MFAVQSPSKSASATLHQTKPLSADVCVSNRVLLMANATCMLGRQRKRTLEDAL